MRLWVVLMAGVLATACGGGTRPPGGGPRVEIAGVRDLGAVRNTGRAELVRGGGAAGRVGGKVLWTFHDTFFPVAADDGAMFRSATGAYAEFATPMALTEPVDGSGAPFQLLPFDSGELEHNANGSVTDRIALWPRSVIPQGENALILYSRVVMAGGVEGGGTATGFALVQPFDTVTTRHPEVFTEAEPPFHHAAALDAGDLYLYACDGAGLCKVARAPYRRDDDPEVGALDRSRYEFWTGSGWSTSVGDAVATVPGSTTGFSVTYNTYAERFVSAISRPGSGRIELRVSSRPEGPWEAGILVTDLGGGIRDTVLHPELFSDAGKTMFISTTVRPGQADAEVRLLEVTLR